MDIKDLDADLRKVTAELLPAWFVARMMDDEWCFGLLLTTGQTLVITNINAVHQDARGDLWMDVWLADRERVADLQRDGSWPNVMGAPTSRLLASVRVDQIIAAIELWDT